MSDDKIKQLEKENIYLRECIDIKEKINFRLLRESKKGIDYDMLKKENKQLNKQLDKVNEILKEGVEHAYYGVRAKSWKRKADKLLKDK